jgi:hypothetical protein
MVSSYFSPVYNYVEDYFSPAVVRIEINEKGEGLFY